MGKVIDARNATAEDIAGCCDAVKQIFSMDHIEQRTPEWYAARNSLIGGSESATMSIEPSKKNPFETKGKMFLRKNGLIEGFKGNQFTAHGQKYEDEACEKYANQYNETVFLFGLVKHPDPLYYYIGGSPDGITASGKLVEIKCPYARQIKEGVVPGYYFPQVQQCMFVLNLKTCDFIQYKPGNTWNSEVMTVTKVDWDPVWWADHLHRLRSFWTDIEFYREKKLLPDYAEESWRKISEKAPASPKPPAPPSPPQMCRVKFDPEKFRRNVGFQERPPSTCKVKFDRSRYVSAPAPSSMEGSASAPTVGGSGTGSGTGSGCKIKFDKSKYVNPDSSTSRTNTAAASSGCKVKFDKSKYKKQESSQL